MVFQCLQGIWWYEPRMLWKIKQRLLAEQSISSATIEQFAKKNEVTTFRISLSTFQQKSWRFYIKSIYTYLHRPVRPVFCFRIIYNRYKIFAVEFCSGILLLWWFMDLCLIFIRLRPNKMKGHYFDGFSLILILNTKANLHVHLFPHI